MKRYLVYQCIIIGIVRNRNGDTNIDVGVNARNVGANSEEEAIGKYILQTKDVGGVQKLDPQCIVLDSLKKID